MWILPVGDTIYGHELCIQRGAERELLWSHLQIGGPPTTPVAVECDVASPVQEYSRGRGRCEVRWANER
jgi:hypothetical protein